MATVTIPPEGSVEKIRLRSELEMKQEIVDIPELEEVIRDLNLQVNNDAQRRRMLAENLRITERTIPTVARAVNLAVSITHIKQDVEAYVCNQPGIQATCYLTDEENTLILEFTSGLVEKLSYREFLFVIGHELGHELFNPGLPAPVAIAEDQRVDLAQTIKVLSWARRVELSVDRVGLLCCQDINSAAAALMKLSSGLSGSFIEPDIDDFFSQMNDIRARSERVLDSSDWMSTHPFIPIRVVALHHFWESQLLTGLIGHSPAVLTTEEMDEKVEALLQVMEPDTAAASNTAAKDCILWGGYRIAASDGDIDLSEHISIRSIVDYKDAQEAEAKIRESKNPLPLIRRKFRAAARKCLELTPAERFALVEKMVVVAGADSEIKKKERKTLQRIGEALKVKEELMDRILPMDTDTP